MSRYETYMCAVGDEDEERLNIQCRLCNPFTERFRATNLPDLTGKTVLDIGCGTGILMAYWAEQVGTTGKVIAIDVSVEQLENAKRTTKQLGHKNIEFIELNVADLNQLSEKFDLIYCRFVLMHLKNQETLLQTMYNQLKIGGYLFCEETMSYEAFFSDPKSSAFDAWKALILKIPEAYGVDFYVGKRLKSLFLKIGLHNINHEICQPIITREEDKGYFYLGFTDEIKQEYEAKDIATVAEINKVLENLKNEIMGKEWLSTAVQHMQIVGQK
jgi:ubiquinone/menaquinone biosynthesis C-methylase UbiE